MVVRQPCVAGEKLGLDEASARETSGPTLLGLGTALEALGQ